jgi:arginyl-tRNA synthetase
MNLLEQIRAVFQPVLASLATDATKVPDYLAMIKPAQNADHGDYQANVAMPLQKVLGKKPAEIAAAIVAQLNLGDMLEDPQVAGPGFINLRLRTSWLAAQVQAMAANPHLGVTPASTPKTYVIDYSGPNVAKPLHVGHLRSTIIGESLVRILRFLGHRVIGDNHLGDWGTQFGMLLYGYKNFVDAAAYQADPVRELARIYVKVRNLSKGTEIEIDVPDDPKSKKKKKKKTRTIYTPDEQAVLTACRLETVKLHQGDPENVALWQQFMPACLAEVNAIYERLEVHFDTQHGESFYNAMLPAVVEDLLAKGIAERSQGAVVLAGVDSADADEDTAATDEADGPVSLIQKSDGAFTYTTTDLATIKYRADNYRPNAILYVVDARQADHFKNLYSAAKRWGFERTEFTHVSFGSVLGEDRKPLKTRDGKAIELDQLLDEAISAGARKYEESLQERLALGKEVPDITDAERRRIAEVVGLGAVKYADLCQHRTSDYVFSFGKMLATDGNTATYMQYAYARCRSIFREGNVDEQRFRTQPPSVVLVEPEERALAFQLVRFQEALDAAATEYLPHLLTTLLWDVAKALSSFYAAKRCHVLQAPTPELRDSRLLLCDLAARVIKQTLELLGIHVLERM